MLSKCLCFEQHVHACMCGCVGGLDVCLIYVYVCVWLGVYSTHIRMLTLM